MKPYYDEDGITIYCGDMLEVPVSQRCDLLLTDPPYARAGGVHTGRSSAIGAAADVAGADQFWSHWFRDVVGRMAQWLEPNAPGFVFCDYKTIPLVERSFAERGNGQIVTQALVWDRQAMGLGSPFRATYEMIAFLRGPEFQWRGAKNIRNIIPCRWPYGAHDNHPAEKPIDLLRFLITQTIPVGCWVFDPFIGSGSSLVAAKAEGRNAIGIEIEERYCELAVKRLRQGALNLFGEQTA